MKRFQIETNSPGQKFSFTSDHRQTKLYLATLHPEPEVEISWREKKEKKTKVIQLAEFIDVKGWKSLGNKLHDGKLVTVKELNEPYVPKVREVTVKAAKKAVPKKEESGGIKPGDTIELDF